MNENWEEVRENALSCVLRLEECNIRRLLVLKREMLDVKLM